jgi:hypothetical protein
MDNILGGLIGIIVIFLFFLLIREVIVWYWKINDILSILKKIEENTRTAKPIVEQKGIEQDDEMPK